MSDLFLFLCQVSDLGHLVARRQGRNTTILEGGKKKVKITMLFLCGLAQESILADEIGGGTLAGFGGWY
jgi:hypothetical protein